MSEPRVTVLMCTYNAANTIQESIESVLKQTYRNFKLLIVNDGSTDETLSLLKQYDDHPLIYDVINKTNSGLGDSRNTGLANINSEWVAFIDADDVWDENKLQYQIDALALYPNADVIVTDMINYDVKIPINESKSETPIHQYNDMFTELALHNFPFQPVTALIRTELFHHCAKFALNKSGQDYYPFLMFAFLKKQFLHIKLPLYRERALAGSLQRSPNSMFLGANARVEAIDKILNECECSQSQIDTLLAAKDRYLTWMVAGKRRTQSYKQSIKYCLTLRSSFFKSVTFWRELFKCILFPLAGR